MPPKIRDSRQPHAVVVGLDNITGLQTARILSGHGVPVIALAKDADHYCCRTKVCEKILFTDTASEQLIFDLVSLGPQLKRRAVLYPCTDQSVLLISQHRQEIAEWFHVVLPEAHVVEMLMDKISFYTYANKEGLPIPGTFLLRSHEDAEQAAARLRFPCILKPPLRTSTWERHGHPKVFKISSAEELLHVYDRCHAAAEVLMAQEWIDGTDADLYSCNCYFDRDARPVVTFVARKLRQWPPEIGVSCLGEECRNDEVLRETVRLFQQVRYRGLGYLEMKRDARTGQHFIIEANVGRPTGRSAIAEAGGVPLLYAAYCDTIGRLLPGRLEQRYTGVKWIYLRRDLQSALFYWRRGDLTLKDWWRSWRGKKVDAVFAWNDLGPFWGDLRQARRFVVGTHRRQQRTPTGGNLSAVTPSVKTMIEP